MAILNNHSILGVKLGKTHFFWVWIDREKEYRPLDDAFLSGVIPGFRRLNEKARQAARRRFLKESSVIHCGKLPQTLSNTKHWRDLPIEKFQSAIQSLLSVGELFQDFGTGYDLLANLLAGLWCSKLRAIEPDFHPVVAVNTSAPEVEQALAALIRATVTRKRWKRSRVRINRKAVLDYRVCPGELSRRIQDFSRCKIRVRGQKNITFPALYRNTAAIIIGADSGQLREAAPYLSDAALILLNCGNHDLGGHKLRASSLSALDPAILETLRTQRHSIATVLEAWRRTGSSQLARTVIQAARASFGRQDERYISVVLEPKRLARAIRYQILLVFLEILEESKLLSEEILETHRSQIRDIYDPMPKPELHAQHAEDVDVFLLIMRRLAAERAIADVGQPFRKADKLLGAWRDISGVRHLVMSEKTWAKEYKRAVRAEGEIDSSFFQREHWERDLQSILAEAEVIKAPSAGARYRYDLYGNGTRDSTYVLAVPSHLLDEASGRQEAEQIGLPGGNSICRISRQEND